MTARGSRGRLPGWHRSQVFQQSKKGGHMSEKVKRVRWMTSGVALTGAWCSLSVSPAHAQEAPTAQSDTPASQEGLSEVVVTAQRRTETIQKSSLSISVLDTKALANVNDAKDIASLTPGVQISQGGSTLQAYVRGIG